MYTQISLLIKISERIFYPRPNGNEDEGEYLRRAKKSISSLELNKFLVLTYNINKKYNKALSLIVGKVKHEKPNEFGKNSPSKLEATYKSTHPKPFIENTNGDLEIAGGLIKVLNSAKLTNVSFQTTEGNIYVESLDFSRGIAEGGIVVLKGGEKRDFLIWAQDCLNICNEIVDSL